MTVHVLALSKRKRPSRTSLKPVKGRDRKGMSNEAGGTGRPWTVRVGTWSARHRWHVVAIWLVAILGLFGAGLVVGTRTDSSTNNAGPARLDTAKAQRAAGAPETPAAPVPVTAR
jgi:hypothetical protein